MKHTNSTAVCVRCEKMLDEGHPDLRKSFAEIRKTYPDVHVSCVYRGKEAQNKAVQDKLSKTPWPKSKHNALQDGKPCSLAMDLFRLGDDGKAYFPMDFYAMIANLATILRLPLVWGGSWKMVDGPHFQLKEKSKS